MAVPKKKTSRSRNGMRHAGQHHKMYATGSMSCPNCGDTTLPHHACPSCGTYKGREVIEIKAKEDEETEE